MRKKLVPLKFEKKTSIVIVTEDSSPTAFQRGKGLYFPPEGRKIMIGIADVKVLNLGMLFPFVEVES